MKKTVLLVLIFTISLSVIPARAKVTPIRVMILDGESGGPYHNWRVTTQVLTKELNEVGMFSVDVVTAPPVGGDFSSFRPNWGKYKVIVFNYDAPDLRWPAGLKASFEAYMRDGGGGFCACRRQRLPRLAGLQPDDRCGWLARSG